MKGLRDQRTWTMKDVMGPSRDGSGLEVSLGPRMMFDQVEGWRYRRSWYFHSKVVDSHMTWLGGKRKTGFS